jgi:formylglycine-generating enzyme required for sulfatase activity/energy-coupling factor transporter ATP-binding protein EcfA2
MAKKKSVRDVKAERDVIMGDQHNIDAGRDVIQGDQNISVVLQMGAFTPPPNLRQLRVEYLQHLQRNYRALDFKGIPQLDALSRELLLEEVYVPLVARPEMPAGETWERRLAGRVLHSDELPSSVDLLPAGEGPGMGGAAPVRVEEAMAEQPRVVVLGDPGSGKSTLLKHLALRLAGESDTLKGTGAPLPILVPLNAYADALSRGDRNLQQYLPEYFAGLAHGVSGLAPLFDSAIAQGRAVILLDGLDEVQRDREHVVDKVEVFAREAARLGDKVVVTSRIVGYRESPLAAKDWSLHTLLDFDDGAIEQFASKWCLAFEKSTLGDTPEARAAAEAERASLLEAIEANPGVANLASNPLLLTILALIKRQGVSLPNRRVELYELYLKTLISAWSKARALDRRPVGPPLDYLQTISVLGPLALWLRQENPTAGLVPEERLLEWLTGHFMGEDWGLRHGEAMKQAREFLDSVRRYSNLLLERGQGRFGFIHLTFEEALAARGLVQLGQLKLDDSLAVIREHLTDPAWRETVLLAIGVWGLVREEPRKAGEVVRAMLKMDCAGKDICRNVLIAGACLEDVGELGLGRVPAHEVTEALIAAMRDRSLPPTTQRDAGFILGRSGWTPADPDAFIPIPAGPFLYGDDKRRVEIKQPFAISKYPITNLQFKRFIDAKGYERRQFWSDEGWAWRTGAYDSKAKEDYEKRWLERRPPEKRGEPFFWHDAKWNNPLAPVVGVSWFEAEAYCTWLSGKLDRPIRLPAEEEWERAARGADGREYPWGDRFDHNRLNTSEFWGGRDDLDWDKWYQDKGYEIASTTVVGQFPGGDSNAGVSDMSGNVWEWTDSWYDRERTYRTVRGGSWDYGSRVARCACRLRLVPDFFDDNFGFRVVSPGSISAF